MLSKLNKLFLKANLIFRMTYLWPRSLGANPRVPRGHAQKGDTNFFGNFEFLIIYKFIKNIVDHKT